MRYTRRIPRIQSLGLSILHIAQEQGGWFSQDILLERLYGWEKKPGCKYYMGMDRNALLHRYVYDAVRALVKYGALERCYSERKAYLRLVELRARRWLMDPEERERVMAEVKRGV